MTTITRDPDTATAATDHDAAVDTADTRALDNATTAPAVDDIIGELDAYERVLTFNEDDWFAGVTFSPEALAHAWHLLEHGESQLVTDTVTATGQDAATALLFVAAVEEIIYRCKQVGDMIYFEPDLLDETFHEMLDRIFPDDTQSTPGSLARRIEADAASRHGFELTYFIHTKADPTLKGELDTCAGHTLLATRN